MNHLTGLELQSPWPRGPLTAEEQSALAQFRAAHNEGGDEASSPEWNLSQPLPESGWRPLDDQTLWRFLAADRRSGAFNFEASRTRLEGTLRWRRAYGTDSLLDEAPAGANSGDPRSGTLRVRRWIGRDHQNHPVLVDKLGEFVTSGNTRACSVDEWIRFEFLYLEQVLEQMREASVASGTAVTSYLYIADFSGVSAWHARALFGCVPLLSKLTKAAELQYPEIAGPIILFNAPRVLVSVYNMVKATVLDPVTAAKIEIHAGVPTKRLLELVPRESLPCVYGGDNAVDLPPTTMLRGGDAPALEES